MPHPEPALSEVEGRFSKGGLRECKLHPRMCDTEERTQSSVPPSTAMHAVAPSDPASFPLPYPVQDGHGSRRFRETRNSMGTSDSTHACFSAPLLASAELEDIRRGRSVFCARDSKLPATRQLGAPNSITLRFLLWRQIVRVHVEGKHEPVGSLELESVSALAISLSSLGIITKPSFRKLPSPHCQCPQAD
jgi:hypothetical protein